MFNLYIQPEDSDTEDRNEPSSCFILIEDAINGRATWLTNSELRYPIDDFKKVIRADAILNQEDIKSTISRYDMHLVQYFETIEEIYNIIQIILLTGDFEDAQDIKLWEEICEQST